MPGYFAQVSFFRWQCRKRKKLPLQIRGGSGDVLDEPERYGLNWKKDKDVPRSPASVTKVMTLLLVSKK